MTRVLITAGRVRSILADARTERDAADALRRHRIRYRYSTAGGYLHIRIPARSGIVTVTRTASRTAPLAVSAGPVPVPVRYPYPVPRWTWDD